MIPVNLGETLVIPYPTNEILAGVNISIKRLSDGVYVINSSAMTGPDGKNVWSYSWTVPLSEDKYQVIFEEPIMNVSGPVLVASGNIIFTVQTDAANSSTTFKTNLTDAPWNGVSDYFKAPALIKILTGNLKGQVRKLPSTGSFSVTSFITVADAYTSIPQSGDKGMIVII